MLLSCIFLSLYVLVWSVRYSGLWCPVKKWLKWQHRPLNNILEWCLSLMLTTSLACHNVDNLPFFQKFVFLFCYSTMFCFATILMILFFSAAFLQVNATWWGEQTVANHLNNGGLCVSVWAELQCTLYPAADGDIYLWLGFALPTRGQATIGGKRKAPTSPPLFLFLH